MGNLHKNFYKPVDSFSYKDHKTIIITLYNVLYSFKYYLEENSFKG